MTPGSIILHENFTFHDGAKGKKYLIILGSNDGVTLMVKTTSQGARYLLDFGCQINHRFPNFHLVRGCCCFPLSTWVCLDEFYLLTYKDLIAKHFKGEVYKYGELEDSLYKSLLNCALESIDITEIQSEIIKKNL